MKRIFQIATVVTACAMLSVACTPRRNAKTSASAAKGNDDGSGVITLGSKKCKVVELIDDMEDNNNQVLVAGGRNGYIYTFADNEGTTVEPPPGGTFSMVPGGANGSGFAAHMAGTTAAAAVIFVGAGFNLVDPKTAYDASKYDGIAFFARRGADGTARMRVKLPDVNTDPDGGQCKDCYNDFGADLTLKEEWTQYFIPFSAMKQQVGWGSPRPPSIDSSKIYSIQFQVQDKGKKFDISVDDLAFVKCE